MNKNRYRRILFFFARTILIVFFWDVILPKIGLRKLAANTRPKRLRRLSRGYRNMAISLGGVHIKVGQFLSTRMDVLPPEITDELASLQDEVPAEAFADIRALAETELGLPLTELFAYFDETPMAAASLGQVHRARLKEENVQSFGVEVVVKVQRPNIQSIVETDLRALQRVSRWIMRYRPIRARADVPALLDEFTKVLYQELDYLAEGSHALIFAENFENISGIRIPAVVWPHTTKRVLTLENVLAIKINEYEQIEAAGISRSDVAVRLFDTYMRQILEDGFFHADPHPGNLFVEPAQSEDRPWQLTFVDFGMVGKIPPNTRAGLRELLIGLGTKDAARVVKSFQMLNVLLPGANLDLIEQAEAKVFDRVWGKSMDELRNISFDEMHDLAQEFRELIYEMPFQIPQDLIFLARTAAILSGICTGLDPDFNIWSVLAPYAEKMVSEEAGFDTWLKEAGSILQTLIALPRQTETLFSRLNSGGLVIKTPALERGIKQINHTLKRLVYGVLFFAVLNNGVQLHLNQPGNLANTFFTLAAFFLVAALWPRRR